MPTYPRSVRIQTLIDRGYGDICRRLDDNPEKTQEIFAGALSYFEDQDIPRRQLQIFQLYFFSSQ